MTETLRAGHVVGTGSASAPARSAGCTQLERLTQTRAVAFTEYLSARHRLSLCAEGQDAGHSTAFEVFELARRTLRLCQRNWEEHVAEHHTG